MLIKLQKNTQSYKYAYKEIGIS